MCGAALEDKAPDVADITAKSDQSTAEGPKAEDDGSETVLEMTMIEQQSPLTLWLTAAFVILIVIVGVLMLQNPAAATLAIFPTETPIPPTVTVTPSWTSLPSETSLPTEVPTITPTSPPTETPRPPRSHTVAAGETLFGIGLRYGVSMESIGAASSLPPNASLQVSQELLIPWPTATPPLSAVEVDIDGETIIADPTDCRLYEIKGGDTFFGIASRERVDLRALMAVNRLTEQSILQPGDTVCIPTIIRGGVLPPTPGPSPSATATAPPAGPEPLYPVREADVSPPDGPFFLQWVAVKDLAANEWYMVELTDLSAVDSHPIRSFTRQTSFQVPLSWRPPVPENHLIRWRVSIVQVTGERQDGSFVYTFGGSNSEDAYFTWLGAAPTPTSTPSATPTPAAQT
jgi:LysM repeat protein